MHRVFTQLTLIAGLLMPLSQSANATSPIPSGLEIEQPWARATPGGVQVGAVYLVIHNRGRGEDRLVGASTPVAEKAELHTHSMSEGMMRMRQIDALELLPGASVLFQPGGHHIMLMGLHNPLQQGQQFALTLQFEQAGKRTVTVTVAAIGAMAPAAATSSGSSKRDAHQMK